MADERTADLQRAVAAGDWPAALCLWETYAAGILEEIGRGACTPERLSEAGAFLAWAERVTLCANAQARTTLDRLHAASQYATEPEGSNSRLRAVF